MDDLTFWGLVDLLDGVADASSVPVLARALLERGDADVAAFHERLQDEVEALLDACLVPTSHQGDTAEWIAAAVVASGRTSYERTLSSGARLDPASWRWEEAEDLLVVALTSEERPGDEVDPTTAIVVLEWKSEQLPEGVSSSYDPPMDFGDEPRWGTWISHDPAWRAATTTLPEGWRDLVRDRPTPPLKVLVKDVDVASLVRWPHDGDLVQLVRVLPSRDLGDLDERAGAYVEAVALLVDRLRTEDHAPGGH